MSLESSSLPSGERRVKRTLAKDAPPTIAEPEKDFGVMGPDTLSSLARFRDAPVSNKLTAWPVKPNPGFVPEEQDVSTEPAIPIRIHNINPFAMDPMDLVREPGESMHLLRGMEDPTMEGEEIEPSPKRLSSAELQELGIGSEKGLALPKPVMEPAEVRNVRRNRPKKIGGDQGTYAP